METFIIVYYLLVLKVMNMTPRGRGLAFGGGGGRGQSKNTQTGIDNALGEA